MGVMLSVKDLVVNYGAINAIKGISFDVNEGEIVTLIGANGAGKTTTLHAVSRLLKPKQGEISFCGQPISSMEAHKIIQLGLTQVPEGRRVFSQLTVQQNLALGAYTRKDGADAVAADYEMVFQRLPRLKERRRQIAGTLSGGEQQMLAIGRALMCKPKMLLLDEPSNDLDLETLQFLEDFLRTWPGTVLFVSHDETLIRNTANVIVHLEALRRKTAPRATVARLPYDQYVEGRRAKFQHQAQVSRKEHAEFQKQMDRFLRIRNQVERQQATISRGDPHGGFLLKKKMHTLQAMGRRFEKEKDKLTQMPELEEAIFLRFPATASVPQGKRILDFQLPRLEAGSWRRTSGSPSRDRRKSGSLAPTAAAKPRSSASWPGSSAPGRTSMGHTCPRTMLRFWTSPPHRWTS